jgi:DNA-binding NarL/FixJ family response regulator
VTIRVVVVDDENLVRDGVSMMLEVEPDIEVVGQAATGIEGVAVARDTQPDVVLMDIRMPDMDGLEATARIVESADSKIRVVILTTFDPDEYVYEALRAGASGFMLKDVPRHELVAAVRTVYGGGAMLSPVITRRLIGRFANRLEVDTETSRRLERLTDRERDVLVEIAYGHSNDEISDRLFIGGATVKSHINHLFTKLGARDRAQAVAFAYESGLVQPGDSGVDR